MCSVSNANTYCKLCFQSFNELKEKSNYFNSENFNCLKQTADGKTLIMPRSAQIRSQEFDFKHFIYHIFTKFIDAFIKETIDAFSQLKFWSVFDIFDPRKLLQSVTEISNYRNREIIVLINYWSEEKDSTYKSVTINQVGDIDGVAAIEDWPGFRKYMFEKRKAEEEKFQMKLMNCKDEKETLCALEISFDAHKLYSPCLIDSACAIIFPNCLELLHLMLIFPTACAERFVSTVRLVKARPRNQLWQVTLENLLFIATETPKTGFTDSEYDYFVDELKKNK